MCQRRPHVSPRNAAVAGIFLVGLFVAGQGAFIFVKAQVAQVLLERAFDQAEKSGRPVKPWSWADTWPVARIRVPRLREQAIVLHGGSGQALAFGPGHLDGTPPAGDPGMAIFAAHRDTHFSFLEDLVVGDVIEVRRAGGQRAVFKVQTMRVARYDSAGLDPDRAGTWLALTTCWPFEAQVIGPLRYIVEAELVP